jgi:hypothetical protein
MRILVLTLLLVLVLLLTFTYAPTLHCFGFPFTCSPNRARALLDLQRLLFLLPSLVTICIPVRGELPVEFDDAYQRQR